MYVHLSDNKISCEPTKVSYFFLLYIFNLILVFACFAADWNVARNRRKARTVKYSFSICRLLKCSNVPDQHQKETFRKKGHPKTNSICGGKGRRCICHSSPR
uniref:Uncharacterized protein n=1 Tax=Micrurus corallinus TaxID=54390 RepID=A0A2D4GZU7_MICCO